MEIVLASLLALQLMTALINSISIRRPYGQTSSPVALLIPLRNEEENIPELLESLRAHNSNIHIYLLNDQSTDRTWELLSRGASDGMTLIDGAQLPPGWMGKPWALEQLLRASKEELIVTTDGDVRLLPGAISALAHELESSGLDYISPYPQQRAESFAERLIQPLMVWTWLSTVPLRLAERLPFSSMAVANGQLMAMRRSALDAIGGFSSVRDKVLEDVELARTFRRKGFHGSAAQGSHLATTRMYRSWAQIQNGYGKSLWRAFGSLPGLLIAMAYLVMTSIYPLLLPLKSALLALAAIYLVRVLSARIGRDSYRVILLHPIAVSALIYLTFYSLLRHRSITWKGRAL